MEKQELKVVFSDPNRPEDVEQMLRIILIGKLRSAREERIRQGQF